jgi:hypothetical protein
LEDFVINHGEQAKSEREHCKISHIGETIAQRDQSVSSLSAVGDTVEKRHVRDLNEGPTDIKDCRQYNIVG